MTSTAVPGPRPNPTLANPAWEQSRFRVLVLRLSPFRDVERSAAHLFLAREARRAGADIYVDLAFLPEAPERRRRRKAGEPLLAGTQSGRPLPDFDLVLVSNSYLLELINLPYLLQGSGLPLRAGKRPEALPPLVLGGSNALNAQVLVTETGDCVADALFFGEGEGQVDRLIAGCRASRAATRRERLLEAAAGVEGLWVAGDLSRRVRKSIVRPTERGAGLWGAALERGAFVVPFPVPDGEEAATARLQITYGCPGRCAFCFEGCDRRPFRAVPAAVLLEEARALKRDSGADTLEILSFNFNTHPEVFDLLEALNRLFLRVNWMSQRPDVLAAAPGLLRAEVIAGKRGYTVGIEGISRRMRDFLGKSLAAETIEALFRDLLQEKVREVKLFYLLTGHESAADFAELETLAARLRGAVRDLHPGTRVIFSFNRLLRLPFTPLRHDRLFLQEASWRPLLERAQGVCRQTGFEFRLASTWEEYWVDQVLALGGYGLHGALRRMAEAGLCYDGGLPATAVQILREEMRRQDISEEAFATPRPEGGPFPFAFVDGSPAPEELWRRYAESRAALEKSPQRRRAGGRADAAPGDGSVSGRPEPVSARSLERLAALMKEKEGLPALYLRLTFPREAAGTTPAWRGAWAARELYRLHPALVEPVLSVREVPLFADPPGGKPAAAGQRSPLHRLPLFGRGVVAVLTRDPAAVRAVLEAGPLAGAALPGDFRPGGFERALLEATVPAGSPQEGAARLQAVLEGMHLRLTVRREGPGHRLEVPAAAARKRAVLGGGWEPVPGGLKVALEVGPKFSLSEWSRLAVPGAGEPPIEVREIGLP